MITALPTTTGIFTKDLKQSWSWVVDLDVAVVSRDSTQSWVVPPCSRESWLEVSRGGSKRESYEPKAWARRTYAFRKYKNSTITSNPYEMNLLYKNI